MAEVAAASSVGGLLSLTIQVIQISQRYISGVRNASKTIRGYFRELEIMRLVLEDLGTCSEEPHSNPEIDLVLLKACTQELDQLRSRLGQRLSPVSGINRLNRLTWPFAEDETRRLTEVLHRYQSSLHLSLSTQNYRLSARTLIAIEAVRARQEQDVKERIVQWLSIADPLVNHTAARDKHEPATGDWFLQSSEFLKWKGMCCGNMWIRSIPGAGKTVLCSTIIDHLVHSQKAEDFILFYYFDFRDEKKQKLGSLLRSLIAQICVRADHVPERVQAAFDKGALLDTRALTEMFVALATDCGGVTVVVDALDESCERPLVLEFLQNLSQSLAGAVQWLVTSRQEKDIDVVLTGCKPAVVTLGKDDVNADIRLHINSCLLRDAILSSRPAWVKQSIAEKLVAKADGMYGISLSKILLR